MTEDFDNELISAFIDGELTAAEQATVNDHLEANPDARSEVGAGEALSGLLRNLPTVAAPEELKDRVLAALPIETAPAQSLATGKRSKTGWMIGAGAMLTAALALFLMLRNPSEEENDSVVRMTQVSAEPSFPLKESINASEMPKISRQRNIIAQAGNTESAIPPSMPRAPEADLEMAQEGAQKLQVAIITLTSRYDADTDAILDRIIGEKAIVELDLTDDSAVRNMGLRAISVEGQSGEINSIMNRVARLGLNMNMKQTKDGDKRAKSSLADRLEKALLLAKPRKPQLASIAVRKEQDRKSVKEGGVPRKSARIPAVESIGANSSVARESVAAAAKKQDRGQEGRNYSTAKSEQGSGGLPAPAPYGRSTQIAMQKVMQLSKQGPLRVIFLVESPQPDSSKAADNDCYNPAA